jgi:hypothetical protein
LPHGSTGTVKGLPLCESLTASDPFQTVANGSFRDG